MFNSERVRILADEYQRSQIERAWAKRLQAEALRDQVSRRSRLLAKIGTWLIAIGATLKSRCDSGLEAPHSYVSMPQDPVYK